MRPRAVLVAAFLSSMLVTGAAFAAESSTAKPAVAAPPATMAAIPVPALPKSLLGPAKSYRTTDNKQLLVETVSGQWYKVSLASACKPLTAAPEIRVTKSNRKDRIGSVVVGKKYCRIESFEQAAAPAKTATAAN